MGDGALTASRHLDPAVAQVLQPVIDAQPDPVLVVDDTHRILLVNEAALQGLGKRALELVDRPCPQAIHGVDDAVPGCPLEACLSCAAPWAEAEMHIGGRDYLSSVYRTALRTDDGRQVILHSLREITAAKQAARVQTQTQQRLLAIVDAIPGGLVHVIDRALCYVFNAGEGLRQLGLSNEALVGKSVFEVLAPDVARLCADNYARVLQGETVRFEGDFGGEHFLVTAAPLRDAAGQIEHILALSVTVTELHQTQIRLERASERMRALCEIAQQPVSDVQELLDHTLNEAIRLTGSRIGYIYRYDEASRRFTLNSWSREVMAACAVVEPQTVYELDRTGLWGEVVRQRQPVVVNDFGADHPLKKGYPEGHVALTRFMSAPVLDAGHIVAVVGVANKPSAYDDDDLQQLTLLMTSAWRSAARLQAELERRDSDARYRALFEHMAAACCVDQVLHDDTGKAIDYRVLDINPAFERITGIPRVRAAGALASELYGPGSVPFLETYAQVAASGQPTAFESLFAPIDKHLSITVSSPGPGLFSTVFTDVTEQRRTEEQLRQTQRLEAVGKLAGGVAHDFNNLLTVINNCADLALEAVRADDPLRQDLEQIRDAGQRAAALTRQLLAFGRRQPLKPEVLDLGDVVRGTDAMLRRLIGEDVQLRTRLCPALPPCLADRGQIEQVLINLVLNARDAMPDGGQLDIETAAVELDADYASSHDEVCAGPHVMLAVSDTGVGMDEATRARVFEPFFTTKPRDRGTGLGLATVYGIVKQSQGHVWVYSEPDKGSSFKIYLPVHAPGPADQVPAETWAEHTPTGRESILLVEDDDAVRRMARRILDKAGYRVREASSGEQAMALCSDQGGGVQLLLTDVIMTGLNGRQLAEQLTSRYPGLRVLYMSGYTDDAIVHRGVLEPGVHFVQKPFSAIELCRAVRRALDDEG